jgi:hypothetical protein
MTTTETHDDVTKNPCVFIVGGSIMCGDGGGDMKPRNRIGARRLLLAVILLGSVWGFFEVVLGGAMKVGEIPYRGDLLTGLGIGAMAVALVLTRRPLVLIGVAAIAVLVKQLAVPILHLPLGCKANSCLAVMLGGGALAGTVLAAGKTLYRGGGMRGLGPRALTGFAAGGLAAAGFFFLGMRLAPCPYLLSFNRAGGFIAFMQAEGLIWAALGGFFFPAGFRVGESLQTSLERLHRRNPALYYGGSAALTVSCWAASALAISAGL